MIVFFVGTPGSGKSFEAVKKIVDNLQAGRTVCTNIEGMDDPFCQEYLKNLLQMDDYTFSRRFIFLDRHQVKRFWKTEEIIDLKHFHDSENNTFDDVTTLLNVPICPKGSLVVIDEVHKYFNARDWNDRPDPKDKDKNYDENGKEVSINRAMADWASTHRHLGFDLVLITQDIDKVDKQVRSMTEWCYYFRKVNFFGGAVQKKYLCYAYSGDDHGGKPLSKNVRTYDPKYFRCYKSYSTADAKEIGFMTHVNILKHPIFYAIPVVLCFTLYMFFGKSSFASGDLFGVSKVQHKYDNLVTTGMKKTAAKPVMKNISSPVIAALPVTPVPAVVLPSSSPIMPEFAQYKVEAFIIDNGKVIVQINGSVVRLPSPHVQKFYKETGFALAETAYFGTKQTSAAFQASVSIPTPAL